jgi:hypothetical protein
MPFVSIILLHQEVGAQVFIARAAWMALVESERPIIRLLSPCLFNNRSASVFNEFSLISWIDEVAVVLVTSALFGILAPVCAPTKCCSLLGNQVFFDS